MDSVDTIFLSAELNLDLVSLSMRAAPRESCGLFLGSWTPRGGVVSQFLHLRNVAPENSRFRVDPRNYREIERETLRRGQEILGVFHSHPFGHSKPSVSDLSGARNLWDEECSWIYVICGLKEQPGEENRGWQLRKRVFSPVFVEISDVSREFLHG